MSPFLKSSIGFQFCANIKLNRIFTLLRLSSRNMSFNLMLFILYNSFGSGLVLPLAITGYCYENRALIPSTFQPKPNLVETTELAYLSSRPVFIVVVGKRFFILLPLSGRVLRP